MESKDKTRKEADVNRAVRIGQLFDLYGALLTDRQQQFVQLHFVEDLSFGEIAREFDISRQAVHDAVKHAEAALEEYDAKLGLTPEMAQARQAAVMASAVAPAAPARTPGGNGAAAAPPAAALAPIIGQLQGLQDRMVRSGGVIYDADALARELGRAIQQLRDLGATGQE